MLKPSCLILLLFSLTGTACWAQEQAPAPDEGSGTPVAAAEKNTDEAAAEPKKPATKTETPDAFKPTEQVDEDYSIPFPVDI